MIKFLKERLTGRKNLLLLKKYTKPNKEFSNESRSLFISKLKKRRVMAPAPFRRALGYSFASLILLSSLTGGAVVYAEKQDVAFNHPLYPMKRLGENIQVKLAPADKKPAIQDEIARKRLTEIKQLIVEKDEKINLINSREAAEVKRAVAEINRATTENSEAIKQAEEQKKKTIERIAEKHKKEIEEMENESKSKTEELDHDFRQTVDSVLRAIEPSEKESKNRERTKDLCESLRKKIREHEEISKRNENWPDFKDKCEEVKKED
ncbi:MAG: DUF5667 domain-containing protein [Patescibacteria group bacterium]